MTEDQIRDVIATWRARAQEERADRWCNTDDAKWWRFVHEQRGAVYEKAADELEQQLQRPAGGASEAATENASQSTGASLAERPQPQEAPLRRFTKQEREPFYFDPDEPLGSPTP